MNKKINFTEKQVQKITSEHRDGRESKEKISCYSEKAKKAAEICDKLPSNSRDLVRDVVSLILEETLPPSKKQLPARRKGYVVGVAVVPLMNNNANNYSIGKPCIVTNDKERFALRLDGMVGNHLPSEGINNIHVRYATDEEIAKFFACIKIWE